MKPPFSFLSILVLASCALQTTAQSPVADTADTARPCPPSGLSVLIAATQTDISPYQREVVSRLTATLAADGHTVSHRDVITLDNIEPASTNAIVVLNAFEANKLRRPVRTLVKRAADAELRQRVLVSTVSGANWTGKQSQVHTVTGASRNYSIDVVVHTIMTRIETLLMCESPIVAPDSNDTSSSR